jgi:hypothetical protein
MSIYPHDLGDDEIRDCARAISVAIYRFDFPVYDKLYSAVDITKRLENMPGSSTSAIRCELNTLKLALANGPIRQFLKKYFQGRIEFVISFGNNDRIMDGDKEFPTGYKIMFQNKGINGGNDLRDNIDLLKDKIASYIINNKAAVKKLSPDHMKRLVSNINTSTTTEDDESDCDDIQSSDDMEVVDYNDKKRKGNAGRKGYDEKSKELSYTIKKMKQVNAYQEAKRSKIEANNFQVDFDILEEDEKLKIKNKSAAVVSLIRNSGSYFQKINGKDDSLSLLSGLIVQNLYTDGISQEKLPIIIGQILWLLFGPIDNETYFKIVKSSSTYMYSTERISILLKVDLRERCCKRDDDCWYNIHGVIDASCKKGKNCVGKIIIVVGLNGVVKQSALKLDTSIIKKAFGSAQMTVDSMQEEMKEGFSLMMGITTDGFVAAQHEGIYTLGGADDVAVMVSERIPDINNPSQFTGEDLIRKSSVVPGQGYNYRGRFRKLRVWLCQMHSYERVLCPFFIQLLGPQGLKHDKSTAQLIYMSEYYRNKLQPMYDAVLIASVGGDPELYKDAPDAIRLHTGYMNGSRWLSCSRASDSMIKALNVPATPALIKYVSDALGGVESSNWATITKYCKCINTDEISSFMIIFPYLAKERVSQDVSTLSEALAVHSTDSLFTYQLHFIRSI